MLSALANASTEAIRAAVQELETVSESYVEEAKAPAALSQSALETPHTPETAPLDSSSAAVEMPIQTVEAATTKDAMESSREEPGIYESKSSTDENKNEVRKPEDWKNENPSAAAAAMHNEATGSPAERLEIGASNPTSEVAVDQTFTSPAPSHMELAPSEPSLASTKTAKTESDAAATTAAAWASWRRIRESGEPPATSEDHSRMKVEDASTPEAIAMAVAAGAEKTPEEAPAESTSDPAAIASIVDSVLADLRPKIFEEISRKMGQKK
jgi:hypothetical protein